MHDVAHNGGIGFWDLAPGFILMFAIMAVLIVVIKLLMK